MNETIAMAMILVAIGNVVIIILLWRLLHKPSSRSGNHPSSPLATLSKQTIARLEQETQTTFKASVEQASAHFNRDIAKTSQTLNELIVKLTTTVVEEELVDYRKSLSEARTIAMQSLTGIQKTIKQQQALLQADMEATIKNRQTELLERLNDKIGTVVANYIVEALGQGVDLGAQREYLLASLERNKETLKKDIIGEPLQ
jgi:hypothetical protein